MPACTALGWKSRTIVAERLGRSSEPCEQPPSTSAAATARRSSGRRTIGAGGWQPGVGRVSVPVRRRVTFSRNVTLSLSRTCQCFCKYCAFATHRAHLHDPDEVEKLLDDAARRRVKELLVLTGEAPDHHPGVRERLAQ